MRFLIVEDDRFQARGIARTIIRTFKKEGITCVVEQVHSEAAAYDILRMPPSGGFQAYVVDMLLPWSEDEVPPPAENEAALTDVGRLVAGLRVCERIRQLLSTATENDAGVRPASRPPVLLYTIADRVAVSELKASSDRAANSPPVIVLDEAIGEHFLMKGPDNAPLADLLLRLLLGKIPNEE